MPPRWCGSPGAACSSTGPGSSTPWRRRRRPSPSRGRPDDEAASPGRPALGVRLAHRRLAGVHRPRRRRPRAARRRRRRPTPSGGSAGAWWPTVWPWTSAGATWRGSSSVGPPAPSRHRPAARPRSGARGGSRTGRTPARLRCGSPPVSRRLAEHAEMGTLRVELDIAEAIAARELGDRDRAEPALEALAARSGVPLHRTSGCSPCSSWSRCGSATATSPAARSLFHQVEELVRRELDGAGGRGWLARTGVLVSLGQEDLAAAEHWTRQTDDAVLAADLRGQGPSRCGAAATTPPRPSTGQSRAAPGTEVVRGLLLGRAVSRCRPRGGRQVRGDRRRPRGRARHAPDGRRGRRRRCSSSSSSRRGGCPAPGWIVCAAPSPPDLARGSCAVRARRGADQPRA